MQRGAAPDAGTRRSSAPQPQRQERTGYGGHRERARGNVPACGAVPLQLRPHPAQALPLGGCHRVGQVRRVCTFRHQ